MRAGRLLLASVALGQAAVYIATGLWPVFAMRSFEKVTGPKREDWLVKTFGVLLALAGGTIGLAWWRGRLSPEVALLGAGSAATLAGADVIYVAKGRLRPVYLYDAAGELALVAGWTLGWLLCAAKAPPAPDAETLAQRQP